METFKETIKIAIDGPSGAGKTTVAKIVAKRLGFLYVDTGAMYRALALQLRDSLIDLSDDSAVSDILTHTEIDIKHDENGQQHVYLDGRDVTEDIRTSEISMFASDISANPLVRQGLVQLQRDIACKHNVIMDGRDIASIVLPHANLKIFLTATLEERATRRFNEQTINKQDVTFDEVKREMKKRDQNDSSRKSAPLMLVSDAVVVDTTDITLGASIDLIEKIIKEKLFDVL